MDLPELVYSQCNWCRRLCAEPLGAGEICEVCLGLCAYAFLPHRPAALGLYQPALEWVERVFSWRYQEPPLVEAGCWWCSRPARVVKRRVVSGDAAYADPLLCPVCDGLLLPALPPQEAAIARLARAYDQLCLAVAA
jgi:hypothetical protein